MTGRKKVLVPVGMLHSAGEELLRTEADLLYCVDDDQLREIRDDPLATFRRDPSELADARAEVLRRFEQSLPDVHAIYPWGLGADIQITAEVIDKAPNLEVIGSAGSGAEMIDDAAATERGVVVVNAAGAGNHIVAEHVIGLMLSLTKRIALADRRLHAEKTFHPAGLESTDGFGVLDRKTLGIIGFGFVGRDLAQKCRDAFHMRVLCYDPFFDPAEAARQGVTMVDSIEELCSQSDFVSIHVPLSARTRGLVGEAELRAMKPSAYLINTSRGPTVDAGAMLTVLEERRIAGAGLDVFDPEPLPNGHPLFDLDNVVLTPHTGGTSDDLPKLLSLATAREIIRALRGERPWNVVNPEVLPVFLAPER